MTLSTTGSALAGTLSVTTPGAGSWTVPDGVTEISVIAVGGGGGGGHYGDGGKRGGHGARIALEAVSVTPGQVISYFVGGGGGAASVGAQQGSGGGGSTNVRFDAAGNPTLIAGGGGGGASFDEGGDACPTGGQGGYGAAGKATNGGIAGPGGGGGNGGKYAAYGLAGGNGWGGPGGQGFNAWNEGIGDGTGFGGTGSDWAYSGSGEGYAGGGGGYGGGANADGAYIAAGAGAGGSLWPGMVSNTPNAPSCTPAGNGGSARQAGGHGSLTLTWKDDQIIHCANVSKTFGDPPFAVPAAEVSVPEGVTAGALSYSDASGACHFRDSGELELNSSGTCTYVVRAAASPGLNPAEQVCTITVNDLIFYNITTEASPPAGGSLACTPSSVASGESSTCTPTANTGYRFSGWGGDCAGTEPICTLDNIQADRNVTALFAQHPADEDDPETLYHITAEANPSAGGSVQCAPASVALSASSTCTATANAGYRFSSWSGDCTGSEPSCTLGAITANRHVTANFVLSEDWLLTLPEGPYQGQPLVMSVSEGDWVLNAAATHSTAELILPPPSGVHLPHGVVSLRLSGTLGESARVVLTYPEPLAPQTRYYKYGPTAERPEPHWYEFEGAHIEGRTITLTLTDGATGDADLSINGVITDPGGPAVISAVSAVPALRPLVAGLLILMIGFVAQTRMFGGQFRPTQR